MAIQSRDQRRTTTGFIITKHVNNHNSMNCIKLSLLPPFKNGDAMNVPAPSCCFQSEFKTLWFQMTTKPGRHWLLDEKCRHLFPPCAASSLDKTRVTPTTESTFLLASILSTIPKSICISCPLPEILASFPWDWTAELDTQEALQKRLHKQLKLATCCQPPSQSDRTIFIQLVNYLSQTCHVKPVS